MAQRSLWWMFSLIPAFPPGLPILADELRRNPPVVMTVRMQSARDTLAEWVRTGPDPNSADQQQWMAEPVLIIGPEGSGKRSVLRACFEGGGLQGRKLMLSMQCSASTTALQLEQLVGIGDRNRGNGQDHGQM